MGIIHVLDEHMTNMIAAGEVVDRPVNIVKECVENSLDAGASSIDIEVFEGGIEGVIVTDDGCGMNYEDARMAFERHATSKISSEDELFSISTMGFRGEALPSIASVARVSLQTATEQEGTRIEFAYGELVSHEKASVPRGCRIEVRGLFLHTPARFKYLKKAAYEFSVIADAVNKLALAHPEVRFTLRHDGRLVFQTSGKNDRREILYQMFGRQAAAQAREFRRASDDFVISGYALEPSITRATKNYIYLSLNGRTIRSWPIVKAVVEGYREYMPRDRYPICFLNVETDYQLVDVNVHPNKLEVRISKEDFLSQLIIETIADLFEEEIQAPAMQARTPQTAQQLQAEFHYPHAPAQDRNIPGNPSEQTTYPQPNVGNQSWKVQEETTLWKPEAMKQHPQDRSDFTPYAQNTPEPSPVPAQKPAQPDLAPEQWNYPEGVSIPVPADQKGKDFLSHLHVIGQLKESYILCEGPEGLVIIDQHAAEERANFEKICDAFEQSQQITQPLMVPVKKNLPPDLMASLEAINEKTRPVGLEFEPFSDSSVLLREEPAWMSKVDRDAFLDDLFAWFGDHRDVDMKEMRRHMLATIACHSSIRFHHSLRREEMEQVIKDLQGCRQPYHCPHGRPTIITMSTRELEKEFERG